MKIYFNSYFSLDNNKAPMRVTAFVKHVVDNRERKISYTDATEELALQGLQRVIEDLEIEL